MSKKFKWYVIDKKYVQYLKKFDNKVENIEYNENLKPYIGIIFSINKYKYYVPISSVKEKHCKMKEDIDFVKIMDNNKILGVLNINNMIPIFDNNVKILDYSKITEYRKFKNNIDKNKYISLLNKELRIINYRKEEIISNAKKLYFESIKGGKLSKRCCNFKLLEEKSLLYKKESI